MSNLPVVVELLAGLNDRDSRLIMDLVSNLNKPSEVLARYGMNLQDLQQKLHNKMFAGAYKEAAAAWNSEMNVQARIKYKAGMLLEDLLPDMFVMAKDATLPSSARGEMTKQLGQLSQTINPKQGVEGSGAPFVINIIGPNNERKILNARTITDPATGKDVAEVV